MSIRLPWPIPNQHDDLLGPLIGEALFGNVFDQRLYAQFALYSTPYRPAVAAALRAELIRRRHDPTVALALLEALRVLGGPAERRTLEGMLVDRTTLVQVRDTTASALGHVGGRSARGYWRHAAHIGLAQYLRAPSPAEISVLDRLVYAVGMQEDRATLGEIAGLTSMR